MPGIDRFTYLLNSTKEYKKRIADLVFVIVHTPCSVALSFTFCEKWSKGEFLEDFINL